MNNLRWGGKKSQFESVIQTLIAVLVAHIYLEKPCIEQTAVTNCDFERFSQFKEVYKICSVVIRE